MAIASGVVARGPLLIRPPHEASAEALQKWLWECLASGWGPVASGDDANPQVERWTHDDNMAVQHLKWAIFMVPNSEHYDLFLSTRRHTPKQMMDLIIKAAEVDPLAAKAVRILTKQRLLHPNVQFSFMK